MGWGWLSAMGLELLRSGGRGGVGVYGDGGAVGVSGVEALGRFGGLRCGGGVGSRILRVQVKLTDCRTQYGYLCQFKPNAHSKPYTLKQVDFFAAYVIPRDVWYLIPAGILLGGEGKKAVTLLPENPRHPERYACEAYREGVGVDEAGGREIFHRRGISRLRSPEA